MSQPLPKADNAASAEFISAKDKACEGIGAHNVRVTMHMVENGVVLGRGEVEVAEFVKNANGAEAVARDMRGGTGVGRAGVVEEGRQNDAIGRESVAVLKCVLTGLQGVTGQAAAEAVVGMAAGREEIAFFEVFNSILNALAAGSQKAAGNLGLYLVISHSLFFQFIPHFREILALVREKSAISAIGQATAEVCPIVILFKDRN